MKWLAKGSTVVRGRARGICDYCGAYWRRAQQPGIDTAVCRSSELGKRAPGEFA